MKVLIIGAGGLLAKPVIKHLDKAGFQLRLFSRTVNQSIFDMSAFVAIHNTSLSSPIYLTQVLYFNQNGKLVDDFLKGGNIEVSPLATNFFYIPYEDKSGTGANFLIEWIADSLVAEQLDIGYRSIVVPFVQKRQ